MPMTPNPSARPKRFPLEIPAEFRTHDGDRWWAATTEDVGPDDDGGYYEDDGGDVREEF